MLPDEDVRITIRRPPGCKEFLVRATHLPTGVSAGSGFSDPKDEYDSVRRCLNILQKSVAYARHLASKRGRT